MTLHRVFVPTNLTAETCYYFSTIVYRPLIIVVLFLGFVPLLLLLLLSKRRSVNRRALDTDQALTP